MSDELDSIAEQQQALEAAADFPHYWKGQKLAPFSFGRNACFERLGIFGRGVTSNLEAAAAIVYLCLLDGEAGIERMDRARDQQSIKELRREIERWADEQGLTMNNAAGLECSKVADAIWTETERSKFEPVIESSGKKKPDPSPQTGPTTSQQSGASAKAA